MHIGQTCVNSSTGATIQKLHNYAAATMTLVDHSRRLTRDRLSPAANDHRRRKSEVLANAELPFVQDLRNFMLHRTLPSLGHSVSIQNANLRSQTMVSEFQLSCLDLLEWDGWTAASCSFLEDHGPTLNLRPVIFRHGSLVADLNGSLLAALMSENAHAVGRCERDCR